MNADNPGRRHSIARRSGGVTLAFLFGHGLGYALMLAANYLLDGAAFGVFYTAWVAITVAMAPATAVLMVMGRVLTDAAMRLGRAAVAGLTLRLLGRCLGWGMPLALGAGLALAGGGWGSGARPLLLLLPLVALVLIAVEILRTAFQALLLFGRSSGLWVASQAAQLALAVPALALTHRVWPGFLAVLVAASLAAAGFVPWFARAARKDPEAAPPRLPFKLAREARLVASYSLFVLINNIDILLGYGLMPRLALSAYAASALLPKAIVLATLPVAQIALPVIVERRADGQPVRETGLTALALVLVAAAGAATLLWLAVPALQSTPLAIRGLDIEVTRILALGAVGLGAARVLVVAEIALGRHAIGFVQAAMLALFALTAIAAGHSPRSLAAIYTAVSWLFFAAAAAVLGAGLIRRQPQRAA